MHMFMAASTKPSNATQILFYFSAPSFLKSFTMNGARNQMMSRQSKTRALAKFTNSRSPSFLNISLNYEKEEDPEIFYFRNYRIVFQTRAETSRDGHSIPAF